MFPWKCSPEAPLRIISGPPGWGKSRRAAAWAAALKERGLSVGGILSEGIISGQGQKSGYRIRGLGGRIQGEGEILLCRRDLLPQEEHSRYSLTVGLWQADPDLFSSLNESLIREWESLKAEGGGTFFLDEAGPLEIRRGLGFFPLLKRIRRDLETLPPVQAVITLRPALRDEFLLNSEEFLDNSPLGQ